MSTPHDQGEHQGSSHHAAPRPTNGAPMPSSA